MNCDTIVRSSTREGKHADVPARQGQASTPRQRKEPTHGLPVPPHAHVGAAPTFSRPRVWAWPLAVLLGFPVGGYMANLAVGAVDSVGAALAGGLIAGAVVGAAQWLALRRLVPWIWIAATSIGMAAGLAPGAALVDYGISRVDLMLMGAVTGLAVGGLQSLVLARQGISGAAWWAVANPPAWALAWLVSSYVISANIDERFTNFGASGCLLYALLTGLLLEMDVPPHRGPVAHTVSTAAPASSTSSHCHAVAAPSAAGRVQRRLRGTRGDVRLSRHPASPDPGGPGPLPSGGTKLLVWWWIFALSAAALAPLAVLVARALEDANGTVLIVGATVGVLAALVQLLGLIRWPFLVPYLARLDADPDASPARRETVDIVFQSFNRYLGVAVGEHLGYLLTGTWTVLVGVAFTQTALAPGWLGHPRDRHWRRPGAVLPGVRRAGRA